jgi:LmbE family N-acetylglucosaminyl deacetylase
MSLPRLFVSLLFLLCVSASLRLNTEAQIRPVYDQGALGLVQLLKRLNTNASALMIGAHPDDEDTALLAYLARGENARTAYLSLTRGDGGQNIIGPELGEALGVIRTEELLQARRLDGAEQFFTRAYDYGFSKTLEEAKQKWDEKIILCDVVRVIRSYRPLVVISQFTGTAADGHGQHQYAGYISPLAVKAAAAPGQCMDSGAVWTVKKFYVRHRGSDEPTIRINTGRYDPLLGRSYFEIAMQARSQHRSQEQGVLELKGDQFSGLDLVSGLVPPLDKETSVFDGLDVSIPTTKDLLSKYDPSKPDALVPMLLKVLSESRTDYVTRIAGAALLQATGTQIDVIADRETAAQGDTFPVAIRVFSPSGDVKLTGVDFNYGITKSETSAASTATSVRRESPTFAKNFNLTIPAGAHATDPYWLRAPRQNDLFTIPPHALPSDPFQSPTVTAVVNLTVAGEPVGVQRAVEYRFADDIRGEIRRELNIVPKVAVAFDRELRIISVRSKQTQYEISVNLTNNLSGAVTGKVRLGLPEGWQTVPSDREFAMGRKGERASVSFTLAVPTRISNGEYEIRANASVNGEIFSRTMQTIAYEHIQTHRIYREAKAVVRAIDLQTVPIRVGYIRGSGDRVPEAIRQLGLEVEEINESLLSSGDLSRFDTIVVGIRAYQVRPDIVANNQRLLEFATNGGTLIVQYQLPGTYSQQNLAPFPTQMGPRVVDENAAVTITNPMHPVFNSPNKITADDFAGWVQERNLYNFVQMDPKYEGLLESHDVGEPENKGGLVIANVGKGKYVYCSYSLFRQLPAGVPGAYRLLANLVSLAAADRPRGVK